MEIEIKIDKQCTVPKVTIVTDQMTEAIQNLVEKISEATSQKLIGGFKNEMFEVLDQSKLIRIYTKGGKVFAMSDNGEYALRLRLYEIEERLDSKNFIRISHSEIINIQKVKSFDLSFSGTICVCFDDGSQTFASRRYVSKIKKILGI